MVLGRYLIVGYSDPQGKDYLESQWLIIMGSEPILVYFGV